MGQSVSFAVALLFVSGLLLFYVVFTSVESAGQNSAEEFSKKTERMKEAQEEDFKVQAIYASGNTSGFNLSIILNNTGSIPIKTKYLTVLDNGEPRMHSIETLWTPARLLNISWEDLSGMDINHSVVVSSPRGTKTYALYNITNVSFQ